MTGAIYGRHTGRSLRTRSSPRAPRLRHRRLDRETLFTRTLCVIPSGTIMCTMARP